MVADEPGSMPGVSLRAGIIRLMLELRDRRNLTYVFITHDLSLAWVRSNVCRSEPRPGRITGR